MSSVLKLILLAIVVAALLYTCVRAFDAWYDREDSDQAGQKATRLMWVLFLQCVASWVILTVVQWEPEMTLNSGHSGVSAAVSAAVTWILLRRKKRA